MRGAGSGGTDVEELTEPGTEVVLEPGDEPAVVMGTLILTSGEQLIMPAEMDMEMAATPAP